MKMRIVKNEVTEGKYTLHYEIETTGEGEELEIVEDMVKSMPDTLGELMNQYELILLMIAQNKLKRKL